MKGSEAKLIHYIDGSDKRFIIPVYQRNYDWKTENCKQLFDDLVKVIRNNRESHFFGSIVSVHNDGTYNEFLVIDGQQRLTTISLLLLAMYNLLKEGTIVSAQSNLADRIYKKYLIDEWQDDETRIKLKPVKNDRKAFDRLFSDKSEHIQASNLTVNYNYFYTRIQKEELTPDELFMAISRLEIINITLSRDDNPQLIFESLNSTGVALSEGDKIRNFVLMGLPVKQQGEFYEKYWNRIEECTNYDVSLFIRDYLSVKQQAIPAMSQVYVTFKAYVEDGNYETEQLLAELLNYAKWYEILLKARTSDKALNACINRLNRLETTVTRPFFLEVLRLQANGTLSMVDVRNVFLVVESYLFRRAICDLPTNTLNKIFLMLHKEIVRYEGNESNYVEKFKYALLSKQDKGRFPDDKEFIDTFSTRPVYLMRGKNKSYLFERFENYDTIEDKDVYRHLDDGEYTIEHIMPQHLTPAWMSSLGDDYEQIHETWLHRIANLTLTGYNSNYSNSPFLEKRDMKHGFKDSGLRMNTWIADHDKWTLSELEERNEVLMGRALTIWKAPSSGFKPAEKQMDTYSLDDDVDLGGRVIARFSYKNSEQPVDSWISMFESVLKILHGEDKSLLMKLAFDNTSDDELNQYVSSDPNNLRGALKIDNDIYVEKNTSTAMKISMLRKFFKAYGADADDLVFYLRDADEAARLIEAGSREALCLSYWAFALEHIYKAHENGGSFHKVHPNKGNWISGFVGINGVSIVCTANFDCARVNLCMNSSDKEKNKKRFDRLYAHKSEIEQALGAPVEWQRSDETKSSSISTKLTGVSIAKQVDWTYMAKFQAEWSRKFFDCIVPYLK